MPGFDNRIVVENVKINDQQVTMVFDSGALKRIIFSPAAKRLGLKITGPGADVKPGPGEVAFGKTNRSPAWFDTVTTETNTVTTAIAVADLPAGLPDDFDGRLGRRIKE